MAALLVAIAVMGVMLSVALPTWSHMIRREKEEELIFRGNQYARAINLYGRRTTSPVVPSIDMLIEQRLLRKKYKDPLSPNKDGEFQLLYAQDQTRRDVHRVRRRGRGHRLVRRIRQPAVREPAVQG